MFKNPGMIIKGFALFVFWLSLAITVSAAILSFVDGEYGQLLELVTIPIAAWLSSLALYAIGCVVEDIQKIRECLERMEERQINRY